MAEQLSVFVDNRPGRLNAITGILRDCLINIRAMTIADHRDYGVAKLLVSDPRLAQRVLAEQGFAAALKPVLAIAIEVGLAYIVGCIIHYIALRVLGWLYEVTHIGWLADYYHRNTAAVVIAVAGVLWIWFG